MSKDKNGISVIICCYNSAQRIQKTLAFLALQEVPKQFNWEIILIDNNSSDNTIRAANNFWKSLKSPTPFYIFSETQQGLIFAKKKGIQEANHPILLFCDDDNWLAKDYIAKGLKFMHEHHHVGLIGGRGTAVFESGFTPPKWFKIAAQYHYAVHAPTQDTEGNSTHIYGAGSIIRKKIFQQLDDLGYHLILSGRKGKKITSGEDIEISFLVKILGYQVKFIPSLGFQHFLPQGKLQKSWLNGKMLDVYSPLIISAYIDVYSNTVKSKAQFFQQIFIKLLKVVLISIKKTLLFQWGFYSRIWLISQLKSNLYRLTNYAIYQTTIQQIRRLISKQK